MFAKAKSSGSRNSGSGAPSKLREQRNGDRLIVFSLHVSMKEEHMFAKTLTAALAGTALLMTAASAQTPTPTSDRAAAATSDTMSASQLQGDWRASKVVGISVYNDNKEKLGSINDFLMDKNGAIKAVVLGVGGFLGMGEHLVAVPLDKVKFVNEPIVYPGTASTAAPNGGGGTMMNPPAPPASTTTGSAGAGAAATAKANPWYPDHAVFNATKDELTAMPEFKYSN
jgi:sporulation protein YlmC with PRC-barrel domain